MLLVGTPATCIGVGHPKVSSTAQITLANGDVITADGIWVNTECGGATVAVFQLTTTQPANASPLSGLRVSIAAPPSIGHGAVLTYQVTLHNPSATSVALSPCPSYTEALGTGGTSRLAQTLLLNCTAANSIGGNASLTYEMKLAVPSSFPADPTKLSWRLEPDGPVVGTLITVT
jgi:hypothetical protein